VVINGGKRGMMVVLAPGDALTLTGGLARPLIA
jgi:Cys-tRNA(Pro)/Cys-tRNA(Cys) deacylase